MSVGPVKPLDRAADQQQDQQVSDSPDPEPLISAFDVSASSPRISSGALHEIGNQRGYSGLCSCHAFHRHSGHHDADSAAGNSVLRAHISGCRAAEASANGGNMRVTDTPEPSTRAWQPRRSPSGA